MRGSLICRIGSEKLKRQGRLIFFPSRRRESHHPKNHPLPWIQLTHKSPDYRPTTMN